MADPGIPTLSLFSGAGGLDLGFLQAGFDIRACVEVEPSYCETLAANRQANAGFHAGTKVLCEDVRAFDTKPFVGMGIRCVIGGPPCQTFSAAGRRAGGVIGTEDDRGQLFQAYCRILKELRPEVFVFENVYGLPGANGGGPWREIVRAFSRLGYQLQAEVLDAADYGVPQHRERLIMVGHRTGDFGFPIPTHGPDSPDKTPLVSVEAAISDLQDPAEPFHNSLGGMYGHLLPLVPEGLNYSYFTAEMGHPEPVFAWRSKFHDLLYKVQRAEPCRTIKAQPGKFTGPFHWKNRHFSVHELKRLQTFPDSYQLIGSYPKVVEQIGNSVPPRLAYVIASAVREQLLDGRRELFFPVRPPGFRSTFRQRQRARSNRFDEIARAAIAECYASPHSKPAMKRGQARGETYVLNPETLFDRQKRRPKAALNGRSPAYDVTTKAIGRHISVEFDLRGCGAAKSEVRISGLKKYLPDFDTLTFSGRLSSPVDVFHAWGAIEDALVERSRFFTLIDIYGHYANRGDTVKVSGAWHLNCGPSLIRALNLMTDSSTCGEFMTEARFHRGVGIVAREMPTLVQAMREVRFDLRTPATHPIIGEGRVICTYPFPLLSPRALVESRVTLRRTTPGSQMELGIAAE